MCYITKYSTFRIVLFLSSDKKARLANLQFFSLAIKTYLKNSQHPMDYRSIDLIRSAESVISYKELQSVEFLLVKAHKEK